MTWEQDIVLAEDRERQIRRGLNQPFGMLVHSVNSDSEQAKLSYFGAKDRLLTISHPFRSTSSWIRAIPESGSSCLGAFRSDEANPHVLGSITRNSLFHNDQYRKGLGVYRPLLPGEIELASTGYAQMYLSGKPKLELRGGSIHRWADQEKLLSGDRSPIHTRQLMQFRSNDLADEERLGIISRPKKLESGAFSTWEVAYPKKDNSFAAEHYISLRNPSNQNPQILFTSQRGHVLDIEGKPIIQSKTQIPLRYLEEYFANDESSSRFEIDEKGNYNAIIADAATDGWNLDIPNGNYKKTVSKNETTYIGGNVERTVEKSVIYQFGENWRTNVNNDFELVSDVGQMGILMKSTDNTQMVFNTRNHYIVLDDTSGSEAIYILHNTGSQIALDSKGGIKTVASDGSLLYLDAENGAITATTSKGSFVTLKDNITLSDKTGSQIINFDGKDTVQISASKAINLVAQQITIASGAINIGNAANLSAALAEPLALLFDAHTHATPVGPSSPPIPPNTATLVNQNPATSFISDYIKVRSNLAG